MKPLRLLRNSPRLLMRHLVLTGLLGSVVGLTAQTRNLPEEIARLTGGLVIADTNQPPVETIPSAWAITAPDGFLKFLSSPSGHHLPPVKLGELDPVLISRDFLSSNGWILGATSSVVSFAVLKTTHVNQRGFIRWQQTYDGIPIFGAQVSVQVSPSGGIESVLSDIARDVRPLDEGLVSTQPRVPALQALNQARQLATNQYPGATLSNSPPQLMIFAPAVLGVLGPIRLVWQVDTQCEDIERLNTRLLIDARDGSIVRNYPLYYYAINRRIRDANNTQAQGDLVRAEGDPACGINEADEAYAIAGDVYDFYWDHHQRDSFDNSGERIRITVRYCPNTATPPWDNASWTSGINRIRLGDGKAIDDLIGHEFTHGVTSDESGLIYENASGAINESFSDIWGEYIDMTNGRGSDGPNDRWWIGEDDPLGTTRYMKDPTADNDPDRRNSPDYVAPVSNPNDGNDWGGVHSNCGVGNKLCYLLNDGDTFNGHTVSGLGLDRVEHLFYEVNCHVLTSGADWTDLYYALVQASQNLGWGVGFQNTLYHACAAVEIANTRHIFVDTSSSKVIQTGSETYPFHSLSTGVSAAYPGDRLHVRTGSYAGSVVINKVMEILPYDGAVVIGE